MCSEIWDEYAFKYQKDSLLYTNKIYRCVSKGYMRNSSTNLYVKISNTSANEDISFRDDIR